MRKTLMFLVAGAAALMLSGSAEASHIALAGTVGTPEGPGTGKVNFVHLEKESSFCCAGSPAFEMGDGGYVSLSEVSINQDTTPGNYTGYGYHPTHGYIEVPYTVEHVGEPPLEHGTTLNTKITFSYTYDAPGAYTVTWSDCCFGTPDLASQVPYEVRSALGPAWPILRSALDGTAQPVADDAWEEGVQPVVEGAQEHQPLGISGGTTRVVAL